MIKRWGVRCAGRCLRRSHASRGELRLELCSRSGQRVRTLSDKGGRTKNWEYFEYRWRMFMANFNPWTILRRLNVPSDVILKVRRFTYTHSYPWFAYSVPIASMAIVADIVAQWCYPKRCKDMDQYKFMNTVKYALLAIFVVGPLVSKYDFHSMKMIPCVKLYKLIMGKVIMDTMVMVPLVLLASMAAYDYQYMWCQTKTIFNDLTNNGEQDTGSGPSTLSNIYCRYKEAFVKIMTFNLMTRPLVMLLLCCAIPQIFRSPLRAFYETAFFTQVSGIFQHHFLGLSCSELQDIMERQRRERKKTCQIMKPERHAKYCQYLSRVFGCICGKSKKQSSPPTK